MCITNITSKVRAGALALTAVLALALSLLSGANAGVYAAPHAAMTPDKLQVASANQTTHQTPGMAATGSASSQLYIGWAGDNPGHHIFVTTYNNLNASVQVSDTVLSGTGVGMCAFTPPNQTQLQPYIVFTGTNDQVYIGWFNGSYYLANHTSVPGAVSYHTPSCTVEPGGVDTPPYIWVAWTGTDAHLNGKASSNGTNSWSSTTTDPRNTANAGIGAAWWPNPTQQLATNLTLAFSGTDALHHINWANVGETETDGTNWTNGDVEAAHCCTDADYLYITWQAADTSDQIYYETWDPDTGEIHLKQRWIHQANAGIGITVQSTDLESCVYFAWGDLNGYLNVEELTCA